VVSEVPVVRALVPFLLHPPESRVPGGPVEWEQRVVAVALAHVGERSAEKQSSNHGDADRVAKLLALEAVVSPQAPRAAKLEIKVVERASRRTAPRH
jgi:hypothetical protein